MKIKLNKNGWVLCFLIAMPSYAEICPTITEINNNHLHGWRAYDKEQNKFVTDLEPLKKEFKAFVLAKWMNENEEGEAQCHYYNTNIYFIKHHTLPINDLTMWNFINENAMSCNNKIDQCVFVPED